MKAVVAMLSIAFAAACGGGDDVPFPEDYLKTYREVRDCRKSGDHLLRFIRVLGNPIVYDAYVNRDRPFPTGSILLKEERDWDDDTCSGKILAFTVSKKLPEGTDPDLLDWTWQRIDAETRKDITEDATQCAGCHKNCTEDNPDDPGRYMYTCAKPNGF